MNLETAFTVDAPAAKVFAALLDLEALAACLPGARLEPVSGDAFQGALRPSVGGEARECVGTLRAVDADEDGRSASAALRAREVAGPGFATALLGGKVTEADGGSRVELTVDGRVAAPGVSEDDARPEAERLLAELAASLEPSLAERAAKVPEPAPAAPAPAAPEPEREAPPLAAAADSARRALPVPAGAALGTVAAAGAAVLGAVLLRRRPRRGAWVEIRYRW
ncbi:MAG TPA: SRPBCC family protein [Solirubrobacteraceae bacterium]|jgi:carbon monoxide dehydrogenase subunit G|nr:SRPBCC family protein [Solirubrobacteraceae bacterium]